MAYKLKNKGFSKNKSPKNSQTISFFEGDYLAVFKDVESIDPQAETITKSALVMVEGVHKDSKGRVHEFSPARIEEVANKTNDFLEGGGRVPWQKDHSKDQDSNVGDLESVLEARIITEEDIANPKLKRKLVGKLGIFTRGLVAKGKKAVADLVAGNIKTLSPGIDMATNIIREISATPTPAIVGLSVFKRGEGKALSWDEAEEEAANLDEAYEEYRAITDRFWEIATNIATATDDETGEVDCSCLLKDALAGLNERLTDLFGLGEEEEEGIMTDTSSLGTTRRRVLPNGAQIPDYLPKQQGKKRVRSKPSHLEMSGMNKSKAAFSLGGVAAEFKLRGDGTTSK